jgi:hypothetical protein
MSDYPDEASHHRRAIEFLAEETRMPIDEVAQLYEDKRAALQVGARITGFLSILATRSVRESLRQRRESPVKAFVRASELRGFP